MPATPREISAACRIVVEATELLETLQARRATALGLRDQAQAKLTQATDELNVQAAKVIAAQQELKRLLDQP